MIRNKPMEREKDIDFTRGKPMLRVPNFAGTAPWASFTRPPKGSECNDRD